MAYYRLFSLESQGIESIVGYPCLNRPLFERQVRNSQDYDMRIKSESLSMSDRTNSFNPEPSRGTSIFLYVSIFGPHWFPSQL